MPFSDTYFLFEGHFCLLFMFSTGTSTYMAPTLLSPHSSEILIHLKWRFIILPSRTSLSLKSKHQFIGILPNKCMMTILLFHILMQCGFTLPACLFSPIPPLSYSHTHKSLLCKKNSQYSVSMHMGLFQHSPVWMGSNE